MPDFISRVRPAPTRQARRHRRSPDGEVPDAELRRARRGVEPAGERAARRSVRAPGATKVVWCGQNSIGVVVMVIDAARKIGVTAVPLNYRLSHEEAAYVTDHCDATIVYVDAEFAPMFERIRAEHPEGRAVPRVTTARARGDAASADELMAAAPHRPPPQVPDGTQAGATMIYTSGTTGKPKGALRQGTGDPGAAAGAGRAHRLHRPTTSTSRPGRSTTPAPAASWAIAQALGQTVVVQRKFDAEDWLRLVDTYRVTSTFSAPTPIRMVCNLPDEVKARYDVSSMQAHDRQRRAVELRPQADLPRRLPGRFAVRGVRLDRARRRTACSSRQDQLRKPGSCGQPAPMVEIKLFDDDGKRGHRHRAGPPRRALRAVSAACSPTTTSSTTSSWPTSAAATRPSATSPTATTRATSTSATARRT